ncbi:MAG: hypothetical protein HFG87_06460 [Dorea sp.]|nr:hypothetical protein [Dorea sp.]
MNRNKKVIARAMAVAVATGAVGAYNYQTSGTVAMAKEETTEMLEQAAGSVLEGKQGTENAQGTKSSEDTEGVFKEESVYVKADAAGNVSSATVTEWIKNPENGELADASELKDIRNIKGDEEFTKGSGKDLKWKSEGNDIYYQGTSDEKLPVDVKITYKLNGKTVKAEDLEGKTGRVEIHIDYENHAKETVEINGEKSEMYTPFTAVTAMMLPNDEYTNVTIDNGKIMSDADKNIVVGLGFPGLTENLKLEDADIDIPESVTVTADVEDASVGPTVTVVSAEIMNEFDLSGVNDFDSLEDSLNELEDASAQLADGSRDASDGAKKLADGSREAAGGASELADGSKEAVSGARKLADGSREAASGARELAAGSKEAENGAKELAKGSKDAAAGSKELEEGSKAVTDGAEELNSKSGELIGGVDALADGVTSYTQGVGQLEGGAAQVSDGANGVKEGAQKLQGAVSQVRNGADELVQGYAPLYASLSGAGTLNEGAQYELGMASERLYEAECILGNIGISQAEAKQPDIIGQESAVQTIMAAYGDVVDEGTIRAAVYSIYAEQPADTSAEVNTAIAGAASAISEASGHVAGARGAADQAAQQTADVSNAFCGLYQGTQSLQAGLCQIDSGASSLAEGANGLANGAADLKAGVTVLNQSGGQLAAGASKLMQSGPALSKGISQLADGAKRVSDGASALAAGNQKLADGAGALADGNQKLADGAGALLAGNQQLADGAGALLEGNQKLADGAGALAAGNQQLADGAGALADGNQQLADGMSEFKSSGIDKLTDVYDNDIQSVRSRIDTMSELGRKYQSFAGIKEGMRGSTKFIIETEGVK